MKIASGAACLAGIGYVGLSLYVVFRATFVLPEEHVLFTDVAPFVFGLLLFSGGLSLLLRQKWIAGIFGSIVLFYIINLAVGFVKARSLWDQLIQEEKFSVEAQLYSPGDDVDDRFDDRLWIVFDTGTEHRVFNNVSEDVVRAAKPRMSLVGTLRLAMTFQVSPKVVPSEYFILETSEPTVKEIVRIWNYTWTYGVLVFSVPKNTLLEIVEHIETTEGTVNIMETDR